MWNFNRCTNLCQGACLFWETLVLVSDCVELVRNHETQVLPASENLAATNPVLFGRTDR